MTTDHPPASTPELPDSAGEEWLEAIDADLPLPPIPVAKANGVHVRVDDRAEVKIGKDVHRVIEEVQHELARDPLVFQRTQTLVTVVGAPAKLHRHAQGTPIIRELTRESLLPRLSRDVKLLRLKPPPKHAAMLSEAPPPEFEECVAPPLVTGPLLACGEWPDVSELVGLSETPIVRPEGTIHDVRGYDAETGYLYLPSCEYPPVRATHSEAALAYAHLADVFCDFPFVDPSHVSACVAAILTILARSAIGGAVPCWLFDAASKRSGKSLLANVIAMIAIGRVGAAMSYPENDEELEKVMAGFAQDGAQIVNFDNVARPFGGAALDRCITAVDTVQLRVLGRTGNPSFPWRGTILASGNNVTARGDMLPRVLCPRLESPLENPESRTEYSRPDRGGEDRMLAWCRVHRAGLVADALSIVADYLRAGSPAVDVRAGGGFSAWTRRVAASLVWVGAPSPMGARRGSAEDDDPTARAERSLVTGWESLCRLHGERPLTVSGACALLWRRTERDDPPDGFDDLREAIQVLTKCSPGYPPAADRFGAALRKIKRRPIGGKKLDVDGETHGQARWKVVPA